jgi:hypothetical protein
MLECYRSTEGPLGLKRVTYVSNIQCRRSYNKESCKLLLMQFEATRYDGTCDLLLS